MAFGKDADNLNKVKAFGGSLKAQDKLVHGARPASRAGAPYFVGQYKPIAEEGANPDSVRLIAGAYEVPLAVSHGPGRNAVVEVVTRTMAYYPAIEHTFMVGPRQPRGYLCSAGPLHSFKDKRDPCLGCDAYWDNKGNKSSPHNKSDLSIFTTLHFANYAKTPQVDKEGNLRMNDKTGEPYYEWVRIFPNEVRLKQQQGLEIRDWNLLHWAMKWNTFKLISEYDDQISKCCLNCGGRFSIEVAMWLCGGCGTDLLDPSDGTHTPAQIAQAIEKTRCSSCHHEGELVPHTVCNTCGDPKRASIFDVDLSLNRTRDAKTQFLNLNLMGFSDPRPLDPRFTTPGPDNAPAIAHALNLPKIYAPATPEAQEQILSGGRSGRTPVTPGQSFSKPWENTTGTPSGGSGPNYG